MGHRQESAPVDFNATGRWDYLFARSADLLRLPEDPGYLATMQPIDSANRHPWYHSLTKAHGSA